MHTDEAKGAPGKATAASTNAIAIADGASILIAVVAVLSVLSAALSPEPSLRSTSYTRE